MIAKIAKACAATWSPGSELMNPRQRVNHQGLDRVGPDPRTTGCACSEAYFNDNMFRWETVLQANAPVLFQEIMLMMWREREKGPAHDEMPPAVPPPPQPEPRVSSLITSPTRRPISQLMEIESDRQTLPRKLLR